MIIHYLHGLDSFPRPERLFILEKLGHTPVALHLDYMNLPDPYQTLKDFAITQKAEFIVGSSLGGMLGFWLAEELGLPCLLLNPAVYIAPREAKIPTEMSRKCPKRYVLLGDEDDIVDPNYTWDFFTQNRNQVPHQRIIRQQGLGHLIDEPTFEEAVRWAIG